MKHIIKELNGFIKKINGTHITILFALSQLLIYLYKRSFLNYFAIPGAFCNIEIIGDLSQLFINFLVIMLIILNIYFYFEMFDDILKDTNYEFLKIKQNIIANIKTKNWQIVGAIFLLILSFSFLNKVLFALTFLECIKYQAIFLGISILINTLKIIFYNIKKLFKHNDNEYNSRAYKLIVVTLIMIIISIIPCEYAESNAKHQKSFAIVGKGSDERIILYNTEDYALVSEFQYNEKDNSVYILNKNIMKINLNNQNIKYKEFNKVDLETNNKENIKIN